MFFGFVLVFKDENYYIIFFLEYKLLEKFLVDEIFFKGYL